MDTDKDAEESAMQQQTQGKKVNYRHLNDPYSDKKVISAEQLINLLEGDDNNQPTLDQVH